MSGKAAEAASLFGGVDMLINNAGITYRGRIEDTDIQVDQRLMAVNYFGQVSLTKGKNRRYLQLEMIIDRIQTI